MVFLVLVSGRAEAQANMHQMKNLKDDLVRCAAVYAALPTVYCG